MAKRKRRDPRPPKPKLQFVDPWFTVQKRTLNLLTELTAASVGVLRRDHEFSQEQLSAFLEEVETRYKARADAALPAPSVDHHLRGVAVRFGLTAVEVLQEKHGFTSEQGDTWMKALLAQGQKNRIQPAPASKPKPKRK